MFLHDNALNTNAFPSLAKIQSEVVGITADLLHGTEAAGFMTSGGTESILCAVKAARERGREERGITEPEMVLPGQRPRRVPQGRPLLRRRRSTRCPCATTGGPTSTAWPSASTRTRCSWSAARRSTRRASSTRSPSWPRWPPRSGANFHTDACMGGFVLPFMEQLGEDVPPWDFRVEGVTTISADLHKLGYAPKGASVLLHRTKALRRYQTFVFDDWLGGFYASPGMQGTRAGAPDGHRLGHAPPPRPARATCASPRPPSTPAMRMVEGVRAIAGLTVLGEPEAQCVAISIAPGYEDALDVFAVGDALLARGWHLDRQKPPDSLHATVSAGNAPVIEDFLRDLAECVAEVGGTRLTDRSTSYATLE